MADFRSMLGLAIPVILAEIGWVSMGVVDTIMIGPLGPASIGAAGVGSSVYYTLAIFGVGLLLGLDTLVSQSHGAGDRADTHHSLAQGVYAAILVGIPLTAIFAFLSPVFRWFGIQPEVAVLAGPFIRVLGFGTIPLLLYAALRRYLQATGHVRPIMFVLVSANLINGLFDWLFIFGHAGFPKLGVPGAALATCLARVYMFVSLLFFIWWFEHGHLRDIVRKPDSRRLLRIFSLGWPAALQILLEMGAFGSAAVLAGRLSAVALAAHQIALNCASVSFMMPLGISSAAAVAVGQAIGRGDRAAAHRNGTVALLIGGALMSCAAAAFLLFPERILRIYTSDRQVLTTGVTLLAMAAAFQLFDGIQVVTTGALRGAGNTRTPMLINFVGYWLFGLPIGYALCFYAGQGVAGLWAGLTLALIAVATALWFVWRRSLL